MSRLTKEKQTKYLSLIGCGVPWSDSDIASLLAEIDALREDLGKACDELRATADLIDVRKVKEVAALRAENARLREALEAIAQLQGDPKTSSYGWAGDLARRTIAQAAKDATN